jgi:hypothetical protein
MDRQTRITLLIATLAICCYVGWFFADCAMDDTCQIVLCGRGTCGTRHTDGNPRTSLWLHTPRWRNAIQNDR